jgi:hypothetical protein
MTPFNASPFGVLYESQIKEKRVLKGLIYLHNEFLKEGAFRYSAGR